MEEGKTLGYAVLVLAVLAVGFAAVNSYYALNKYTKISELTGFTGSAGYVNVTVATIISVNFTSDAILWGAGSINTGQNNASLTAGDSGLTAVARGNWSTTGIRALSLENIGSVNASLSIKTDKNETGLFAGSAGHRMFRINVTNNDAASCNGGWTNNLSVYVDVNITDPGNKYCAHLGYLDTQDQVNISVMLVVPYDGTTGALTSTMTATAATAG